MSVPSAISQLPPDLIAELDRKLLSGGFSGYNALVEWLTENGHKIAKSQISRHAQVLKQHLFNARQQALYMAEMAKLQGDDDRGNLIAMAADIGIMRGIEALAEIDPIENSKGFAEIARSVGVLGSVSLKQKEWSLISADKIERALKQVESDESGKDTPSSPAELMEQIHMTILGFSRLKDDEIIDINPS